MFDETNKYRVISHQLGSSLTDKYQLRLGGAHLKSQIRRKKVSNRSAVFGGAGFIGTNLVYQLIEDGQQVFNFDNLSGLGNLLNIAELMQQSRHSFARCDIANPEEIRQALLMAAADTIYFCITPKNPEEESSLDNFRTFFETVKEWRNGMTDKKIHKIVVVVSEHYKLLGSYGHMYAGLLKLLDGYVADGLPISSLLVPPAFGPFQQPDSPISMIIYRAIEGETIPVVNPEEKVSDLVYVKDVVDAIVIVEKNGKIGGHYHLAGPSCALSNLEAADVICESLNEELPPPVGRYQALIEEVATAPVTSDISKDEATLVVLGLQGKTSLEDALKKTVNWYLNNPRWYNQSRTRFFYLWQNPETVLKIA